MKLSFRNLRFPVEQARGRRYPEPPHPYRNEFQRDRDRIVHARAFRRLENKTQVFPPGVSDHFRNRLTHTIEVAQIARTVAMVLDLDEDLTEALALSHDIGHPPFAHAGEKELDQEMARFGDRFDHNLHALRIVEQFERRYARFPGLNLTFEVREGMAKHSRDFEPGEFPELDEYLPGLRPPLEAQIIDPADEIAYNTADLDDAYSANLISLDEVCHAVPAYGELLETIQTQYCGASIQVQFRESIRSLIDWLVSGLIEGTVQAVKASGVSSLDDIRRCPRRLVRLTEERERATVALKKYLLRNVYQSEVVRAERERTAGMIPRLFRYYMEDPTRLPVAYAEQLEEVPAHRLVCDYLAGMTDGYLIRIHEQLFGGQGS
jgi:dGTPase